MARRSNGIYDGNAVRKIEPARRADRKKRAIREEKKLIKLTEKQLRKARRQNINYAKASIRIATVVVLLAMTAYTVFGQVRLTELTYDINTKKSELNTLRSVEVELQMKVASGIDSTVVEAYARNQLGMESINSNQVIYINLEDENEGVVHKEDEKNIFLSIGSFFGL